MSNESSLLKNAVIDAKAIRETALQNAKEALEEAFTPRIKTMLANSIQNEMNDLEQDPGEIDTVGEIEENDMDLESIIKELEDDSDPKIVDPDVAGSDHDDPTIGLDDYSEVGSLLDEDDINITIVPGEDGDNKLSIDGVDDFVDSDVAGSGVSDPTIGTDDFEEVDINLDDEETNLDGDEEIDINLDDETEELDEARPGEGPGREKPEQKDWDIDLITGEKMKKESVGLDEWESGSGPGREKPEQKDWDIDLITGKKIKEDSIDLDELMRELNEEGSLLDPDDVENFEYSEKGPIKTDTSKLAVTNTAMMAENKRLRNSLKEHVKVVKFLKSKLNEINLLNAKLLFTNKLFKGYALNGEQKKKIVETFDRTGSLREIKLVYSTILESFKVISPTKITPKKITEGLASKPAGNSTRVIQSDSNAMVKRFQKLANINKDPNKI